VHPPLLRELHLRLERFRAAPGAARILLLDAALLAEWGDRTLWDRLVVVTAPRGIKAARLVRKRRFTEGQALSILEAQMSDEERAQGADFIVENSGDLERLEREASRLWDSFGLLLD
jgi:dephospho-CoA kinase